MVRFIYVLIAFGLASFALAQSPREKRGPELPEPFATPSAVKHPKVIGWPKGRTPTAAEGFRVTAFVRDIESPRWIYVLPNGDVLVAQSRTLPAPKKEEKEEGQKKQEDKEQGLAISKTVTGTSPNKI